MSRTVEIGDPTAAVVAARSCFYALMAAALRAPCAALHNALASGGFARDLDACLEALPWRTTARSPAVGAIPEPAELGRLYTEQFEIGGPQGPPALLYEAEYGGGRLKVMEDVLRFYDHFGVEPARDTTWNERPDHLATELEFMHFLAFREAEARQAGEDTGPYRDAQRDFLQFHLRDLVAAVAAVVSSRSVPVYPGLCSLLDEAIAADLVNLSQPAA